LDRSSAGNLDAVEVGAAFDVRYGAWKLAPSVVVLAFAEFTLADGFAVSADYHPRAWCDVVVPAVPIDEAFGHRALKSVRPSEVKAWTAKLSDEGLTDSTIYALHSRMGQLLSDAVHDGLLPKSPLSRRTAPKAGEQRPYIATTKQVWALHDAMPGGLQPAVLLAAFAGLRVAEAVALRVSDVDFMRGIVSPAIQAWN
jgi:integrase